VENTNYGAQCWLLAQNPYRRKRLADISAVSFDSTSLYQCSAPLGAADEEIKVPFPAFG